MFEEEVAAMSDEATQSRELVGAVMVVGGGVGGIQAALDLAESGFKVYLVEAKSAIGGHMAQLDKTFPTNDCAMCTLAPRLVEAGRNKNVEILTDTEVVALKGEAGDFTAALRRHPRYVDTAKCIGCGDCEKVCPIILADRHNETLSTRHAAYRLYPQAIPSAYAIEKRGVAPCRNTCPANTSAQGYIALIKARRYADALEVIKQYNPFPATVGRVCSHPCEPACARGKVDEPLAICALKRFVADRQAGEPVVAPERRYEEEVAVVGSGPAGLSCAHQLARLGYKATVFEALPVAGGMMRVGIPAYRLPRAVLEREIDDICREGVEIRLDSPVRDVHGLQRQGYKAVFLAVGAHQPQELGIPGERGTEGVHYGVAFLRRVSLGETVGLGKRVIVIGGGNTAIDAARTALRTGAGEVTLVYRRTREEMPALPHEVEAGEAEGMRVELLTAPVEVLRDGERLRAVRCIRMQLGEPDAGGRRRPAPIPGSEFEIQADAMIAAIAQAPELSLLEPDHGLKVSRGGWFEVDPVTLETNVPGVFAGGDAAQGPGMLIDAIAAGRRGALSIDRYLRGEPMLSARNEQPLPVGEWTDREIEAKLARGEIRRGPRVRMATEHAGARILDFREVELGLTEEEAVAEAERCLACGICAECQQCVKACGVHAVVHEMVEREEEVRVGAVILAPGYQAYRAEMSEEFGYGRYPNVVTALQFERLLSASGPTMGHVRRPSDNEPPRRIAFLQCIGSRDREHDYCSAVCCMYATKEAIMAKEHEPDLDVHVYMMDMRAFSKGYWSYFERARDRYGVHYHRSRPSAIREIPETGDLVLQHVGEDGGIREETFSLVVLSVGMEISDSVRELGRRLGIELDEHGFCHTVKFNPLETSRPGIYAVGPFREPKDIPESIIEACGAAAAAGARLGSARFSLTREAEFPPERDVAGEGPRIGVFVCSCGSNIGGFVDVAGAAEYAAGLPNVVHAESNLYSCSEDSIRHIIEQVKEHALNRVVVASCTPLTHQPLFQDSLRMAGLNPYLFEMANIRNQCSWVHSHDKPAATAKARDLILAAVARAALLEPQHTIEVPVQPSALVVGGGAAGMTAALALAEQGFPVHLVEKEAELGGNLRSVRYSAGGQDPQQVLKTLVGGVQDHPQITLHLQSRVDETSGFMGNFTSRLKNGGGEEVEIAHGVTVLATGAKEYRGSEYGYGSDPRVLTQQELETQMADGALSPADLHSVAMIQCVGPAEKFCARICCSVALKNALKIKEANPASEVVILYRDIRAYGFRERIYTEARAKGILFVRYDEGRRPEVSTDGNGRGLRLKVRDPALGRDLVLETTRLVLSMPAVPREDAHDLAAKFKVPTDADGFFLEAHVKLRPVDFASDGMFMAGMAHFPKMLDETMIQAQAAAARAARILSREFLAAGGRVAVVDPGKCVGCLTCVRICPFGVPRVSAEHSGVGNIVGAARVEAAVCQGCGSCAAECPAQAIELKHYTDGQMAAKVRALLNSIVVEGGQ